MGYTVLHYAAKWDRVEVAKHLVLAGAPIDQKNWEGETPLVLARRRGNWAMVRALQELKEELEARAIKGGEGDGPENWYNLPAGVDPVAASKSPTKAAADVRRKSQDNGAGFDKDVEEVVALTEEFQLSLSEVQSIKAGFAEWDITNSGTISHADIAHVLDKA